jgi:hypothetical protein
MRRLPFGPAAGTGTPEGPPGPSGPSGPSLVLDPEALPPRQALLDRMNAGEVAAAPPKTAPAVVTVDQLEEELAGPIITLQALPAGLAAHVPNPVGDLPTSSDFVITLPGDPVRPTSGGSDSTEATRFKKALNQMYAAFDVAAGAGDTPPRRATELGALAAATMSGLHPDVTVPRRALGGIVLPGRFLPPPSEEPPPIEIGIPGPPVAEVAKVIVPPGPPDPLTEVMAYPVIDLPMFQPLVDASSELFCPNVNLVEPNSITLLETNPPFIESYLMGLNHEMARELLWREYPTDQRGSVFRQFWDPRVVLARPGESPEAWRERVRDIPPIHTWDPATGLGKHNNRGPSVQDLVLVIRGELLKKYPTAVIYAHRADWRRVGGVIDPTQERKPVDLTPAEEADPPPTKVRMPLYEAKVEPDIYFLGFDLTEEEARGGTGEPGDDDPGWFFVIKERPGEPRFGLDVDRSGPLQVWNDLAWPDVLPPAAPAGAAPAGAAYIRLDQHVPPLEEPTAPADVEKADQFTEDRAVTWDGAISSADVAYILFQAPVLVAVHAREMLKHA